MGADDRVKGIAATIGSSFLPWSLLVDVMSCFSLQILVLELNDEAAEQMVEAKIVDLLQGQEGFRWKVMGKYDLCAIIYSKQQPRVTVTKLP